MFADEIDADRRHVLGVLQRRFPQLVLSPVNVIAPGSLAFGAVDDPQPTA